MFVDVGDGDEARNTITLNIKLTRKRPGGEPADRLACFLHGFLQSPDKQPARDRTTLGKFFVSLAAVGRPAQSGDDPLADVTAEVQNEIAGGVRRLVRPPPDLFFAQQ